VHNYLQAHLYANATAEDFWNAQTANSHLPVDKIMSSYVTHPGVPLLDALGKAGERRAGFADPFLPCPPQRLQNARQPTGPLIPNNTGLCLFA